ncbi:MAG: twin-arginine translocase TatA/TatE family subunit [Bacteroidales bacterium]
MYDTKALLHFKILIKFAIHKNFKKMILIFLDIGGMELLLIIFAIVVVFGPKKIPEMARKFGKAWAEVKKASYQIKDEINNEIDKIDHIEEKEQTSNSTEEKKTNK